MNEVSADASKGSVFEDVLEVLWAPSKVFDRARAKGVGMYILLLTAVTLVIVLAILTVGIIASMVASLGPGATPHHAVTMRRCINF